MRQELLARKRIESKTGVNRPRAEAATVTMDLPRSRRIRNDVQPTTSKTIVVPIDFTEASHNGLDYAVSMAKWSRSDIVLVHVVQPGYAEDFVDRDRKKEIRTKRGRNALARLTALANARRNTGRPMKSLVVIGEAAYEILQVAERLNARMIVLGRQDRSPLSRLIFGSVTAEIIDAAKCPVLVVNGGNSNGQSMSRAKFN